MNVFAISNFKKVSVFTFFLVMSFNVKAQTISIPDSEFERYLIADGFDSDGVINGSMSESDALGVSEFYMVNFDIESFEGMQFFSNLTSFYMRSNYGAINSINFGNNLSLAEITIYDTPSLSDIDVSQNLPLTYLVANTNGLLLDSVDVMNNENLETLVIHGSNLSSIDLTNNDNIFYLDIGVNPITELNVQNLIDLEFLIINATAIQEINLSSNINLAYLQANNGQLNFVNLRSGANDDVLGTVVLTDNPNLSCILIDDIFYSENATGWFKDSWSNYLETLVDIDNQAQDFFETYDGEINNFDILDWFENNGGATTSTDCGGLIWSYEYTITTEENENGTDIFYGTVFTVTDEYGNTDTTSASYVIVGVKHFTEFTYGSGSTICEDLFDVNTVIIGIEPDASLSSSDIEGYNFYRIPNFEDNEGPSGATFSATVVDFPDTGAGSYSYLFKVEVDKSISLYRPESDTFVSIVISDEAFITLNDKTVPFITEEIDDFSVCPGTISSLSELSERLVFSPDLPPQTPIDLDQYWNEPFTGPGTYTFDPEAAFNCPTNSITVTFSEEEELFAGDAVLDAVDDSTYSCGDTVTLELNTYLDSSADPGGKWFDSIGNEISGSVVDFPDTGAGQFTNSFSYRQENDTCGFFSEADYTITYDVVGLSTGTNTTIEFCSGIILTEQNLIDELGADSGGSWSPSLDPSDVQPGTYNYTHGDCGTEGDSTIEVLTIECTMLISPKIYLQGAFLNPNIGEEILMRDDLRIQNLLPTTSPYSDGLICDVSVFNAGGASGIGSSTDDIVDWVFVELRNKNDASDILYARSALLQRDGTVVAEDGISEVSISGEYDDYYLSIKHRNHLGVMSGVDISLNDTITTHDFTSGNLIAFGEDAQAVMDSGTTALWAGDVNGDGQVRYLGPNNDTNFLKNTVLIEPGNNTNSNFYPFVGYNNADINMNGQIRYLGPDNDTNILKFIVFGHPSNAAQSNFFPFTSQIPN